MGSRTAITPEDLVGLPRPRDGKSYELVHGETIVVGNAKLLHELVKMALARKLISHTSLHGMGQVFVETMFALSDDSCRIPDVSYLSSNTCALLSKEQTVARVAPDLAIEIISDSETANQGFAIDGLSGAVVFLDSKESVTTSHQPWLEWSFYSPGPLDGPVPRVIWRDWSRLDRWSGAQPVPVRLSECLLARRAGGTSDIFARPSPKRDN